MPTNFEVKYIKTIKEFIVQVKDYNKGKNKVWYRGHSKNEYKLEPSIYRKPYNPTAEKELSSQFKARAIPYLSYIPDGNNYWEWLSLMQHHKIPTRLLDWTESALIALAFAVVVKEYDDDDQRGGGAHVWCLDPLKLNGKFNVFDKNAIPNINEDINAQIVGKFTGSSGSSSVDFEHPIAIYGAQINPRIVSQKGVYTIFTPNSKFHYDDYIGDLGLKIIIRTNKQASNIAKELFDLGISESMLFPELDSISAEIIREYKSVNK